METIKAKYTQATAKKAIKAVDYSESGEMLDFMVSFALGEIVDAADALNLAPTYETQATETPAGFVYRVAADFGGVTIEALFFGDDYNETPTAAATCQKYAKNGVICHAETIGATWYCGNPCAPEFWQVKNYQSLKNALCDFLRAALNFDDLLSSL